MSSTRRPNERSPLLPTAAANAAPSTWAELSPLARLRRARYVLVPLLIAAIVGLLYVFSTPHGGSARHVSTRAPLPSNLSDAELLTLLPPFDRKLHPLPPRQLNRSAFHGAIPTNAFWTNLLVADDHGLNLGAGQVTLSPYTVRAHPKRLEVSYGDVRRVASSSGIAEFFNVDVSLTAYSHVAQEHALTALLGDGNSSAREVVAFDPLSATVRYHWPNTSSQFMDVPLVRGAPFVTVEYHDLVPVVELNATVYAINRVPVERTAAAEAPTGAPQEWTAQRFEMDIGVDAAKGDGSLARQTWLLFFAEPRTLRLQFANEKDYRPYNLLGELTTPTNVRLVDSGRYSGAARLAVVPAPDASRNQSTDGAAVLDAHADSYPVGASVEVSALKDNATAHVTFSWRTRRLRATDAAANGSSLLMLAHPHHAATLRHDASGVTLLEPMGHRTLKSFMTPVVGDRWTLRETLPDVGFEARATLAPEQAAAIRVALQNDSMYKPEAEDPYFFGKEIARQARLVLIADELGEREVRERVLDRLQKWTEPWLVGENEDPFVYDESWGGLCSRNGLAGVFWMTDFGNGWYNDHHFHYGYFVYALAVVAKFRPSFAATHKAAIVSIARDIASFDPNDTQFPFTRHFSWFDSHSFASGVYTLDGGKSQESVSEAINAYYGVYLLGRALGIEELATMGHVLTAMETRAAKLYWQMPSGSDIYEPVYAQHRMTGQVACTKVSYATWFGPEVEHMHLINMMPFTAITPTYLARDYVKEEYAVLEHDALQRVDPPVEPRWRGYSYLALAMLKPAEAWQLVQNQTFFDDGSSRTSALYWIATQQPTE
ncbi:hypothetical protein P43SY_004607 [Pythium insidiosum]|uniref:glucan endo-1,3-beta-D-glucosidase n=1 Tax=Pythium insidiosum TaxID=114742 RepID=A0AAD5LLR6_PYTIN|nr:hypothetical protein P43SY_004607 [Pythium insidiosum]